MATKALTPFRLKAEPTLPGAKVAPLIKVPWFVPMESKALLSARHQASMPGGTPAGANTLRKKSWSAERPAASVTRAVKLKLPAVVGVPLRRPVELKFSPGGGLPLPGG